MKNLTLSCLACTDTRHVRPPGPYPLYRHGAVSPGGEGEGGGLENMERSLEGLTAHIPVMTFDEVPYHLKRHTMGVPQRLRRFL